MNVIEPFQVYFWKELGESNARKTKRDPLAVVVIAKHDNNGMFSAASARSLLLQISKTHKISVKIIDDACQFGASISDAGSEAGSKISLLVVMAHGHPNRMQFGRNTLWNRLWHAPFYETKHIVRDDFASLSPDGKIILYSCTTGQGIAQKIANISKRTVCAPTELLLDTKTCLQHIPNQEFNIVTYDDKNQQHMQIFTPNGPPLPPFQSELYSEANKRSFSEMSEHLKDAASRGDANAQWKLGMFYLLGMGSCEKSEDIAVTWLAKAAVRGVTQAQLELGHMYLSGRGGLERSEKEAGKWFFLSASNKLPQALFQMGICYLSGQCGFEQSDEKAAEFFTSAAKNGISQSLFNLGVLYEHGRGVQRSLSYAKHLYRIADGLGISEAKIRLYSLLQTENERQCKGTLL